MELHSAMICSVALQLRGRSQVWFLNGVELDGQSPLICAPCPPSSNWVPGVTHGLCPASQECVGVRFQPSRDPSLVSPELIQGWYELAIAKPSRDQAMVNYTYTQTHILSQHIFWMAMLHSMPLMHVPELGEECYFLYPSLPQCSMH